MTERPSDEFPFGKGDDVLVRVRENGTSGTIVAKFEAECIGFVGAASRVQSPKARFSLPWGSRMQTAKLRPYEAEFEVIDDG